MDFMVVYSNDEWSCSLSRRKSTVQVFATDVRVSKRPCAMADALWESLQSYSSKRYGLLLVAHCEHRLRLRGGRFMRAPPQRLAG